MAELAPEDPNSLPLTVPAGGRLLIEWFLLVAATTVLVVALLLSGATARLDNAIYDFSVRLQSRPPPSDIIVIAIDARSLASHGKWPWPRQLQAQLVISIAKDHPRAIALDLLPEFTGEARGDQAFRDAMRLAPVFLPIVPAEPGPGSGSSLIRPAPLFAAAAAGLGRGDATPDGDGSVRRAFLNGRLGGAPLPHLMTVVAQRTARGAAAIDSRAQRRVILIPYAGPDGRFRRLSASDVVDGRFPPGLFTGKYVLVGATARQILDTYPTPSSGAEGMANVEIDANVLDALLHHHLITELPIGAVLALSVMVVWLLATGILLLKPSRLIVQGAAAASVCIAGASMGLAMGVAWFPPVSALIASALFQLVWSARRLQAASDYFAEELAELQTRAGGALFPAPDGPSLPLGDSVSRQMVLIDDTKRRMRALRQFASGILTNFPEPVLVVSAHGRIIMQNQAATILGDRMGRAVTLGAQVQPLLEDLEAAAGEGRKLWPPPGDPESPRGVGPGGRIFEARYTATTYAAGEPLGWTLQLIDVTALVSAMRQREDALKLFSHDMRAPQSAILAALENEAFHGIPPALRANIERNALRTISLADDFMRLAQAESLEYQFEPIDIVHALGDAADALWPMAQAASVKIVVRDPGREFVVSADRGLLSRALINLIDIGLKVSPPDRLVECGLAQTCLRGRPAVALSVTNHAIGRAAERQQALFKRFARTKTSSGAGRSGTARRDDTALGLAVVHTVVVRHDGVIGFDCAADDGATFTITLPLVDAEGADEPESAAASAD